MFALILAPVLALQGASATAVAIKNDAPETWTIEYPYVMAPMVQDYRRCLNMADRKVTGNADFEQQHRTDIPRCAEVSLELQAEANAILAGRAGYEDYPPKHVAEIFDHIGRIHIARGADLDQQFMMAIEGAERARDQYEANKPKGLVIELHDASVVKARVEETATKNEAKSEESTD
jgi:hypothetical protein